VFFRDFPVVQAFVIVTAVIMVGINLLVDLCYVVLDPRIAYS
jgi:peptide/nickel transport system permease protein